MQVAHSIYRGNKKMKIITKIDTTDAKMTYLIGIHFFFFKDSEINREQL